MGPFHPTLFLLLARLLVLPMLVIAVNSPNLAHQHWEGKETAKRPNNLDGDCCITDFQAWMVTNGLKINDTKMEFLFVGSRQQLSKVQLESVTVQDSEISVRNLGACLMGIHVSKVCSKDLRDLYSIRPIRKYLSEDATKVLVHAFVTSRLDYCNYLLFGFQHTNVIRCRGFLAAAAARIVCLVPKFSHHTPAFIIYIASYQCPSASSATRPPSSRWCWPCLPKEVSKIQGKWSLQFKI